MGQSVTVARDIVAEPEDVWRVITDLDNAPKVLTGVEMIERVEGEGYDIGVRWRETRRMFGRTDTEEMWVSAVDAPRTTTVTSEAHGTTFTTVFDVQPTGVGTRLEVTFSAEEGEQSTGQRILAKLFSGAGMKATKNVLEQDLDDIAAALR